MQHGAHDAQHAMPARADTRRGGAAVPVLLSHVRPTWRVCSSWMRCWFSRSSPVTRTTVTSWSVRCLTRMSLRLLSIICCFPLPTSSFFSPSLPPVGGMHAQLGGKRTRRNEERLTHTPKVLAPVDPQKYPPPWSPSLRVARRS